MKDIYNKLLNKINKEQIFLNEPMHKHTTFKIGGNADIFLKIRTIEELKYVLELGNENNIPITVIGNGSNLLIKERWN